MLRKHPQLERSQKNETFNHNHTKKSRKDTIANTILFRLSLASIWPFPICAVSPHTTSVKLSILHRNDEAYEHASSSESGGAGCGATQAINSLVEVKLMPFQKGEGTRKLKESDQCAGIV